MGMFVSWFTTVVLLIAGAILANHLGYNVAPIMGSMLHGVEHALGRPLF
jgi:hypothetical protein